jgi:hypothetical protein
MYARMTGGLTANQKNKLETLLTVPAGGLTSGFTLLKKTPGPAKLKYIREWAEHLEQLDAILDPKPFLAGIPHTKVRQFAAEATALETGDMRDIRQEGKRHALLLCLLRHAQAHTRDELVEMFLRRMRKTENAARQKLADLRDQHRELEEALLQAFGKVLQEAKQAGHSDAVFGKSVRQTLAEEGGVEALQERYEAVAAYHRNNYLPLLWPVHAGSRAALFRLLDLLEIGSATQDTTLLEALAFVKQHRHSRKDTLPSEEIALGFCSRRWQAFIETEKDGETLLGRKALEVCVFVHVAEALNAN